MQFVWDIDPVLIHLGSSVGIRYYGVLFALVFVGGYFFFRWQILRAGGTEDDVAAILIPGALGTVIGARLGHVIFYEPGRVWSDPWWLFQVWKGGLASHGALIGLALALWYYARRRRQPLLECTDRFAFSAALGALLVRLGNFFNSEIVGRVTHGSWGVRFPRWDQVPAVQAPLRHPSQLYEAALALFTLGLLYIVDRRAGGEKRPRGLLSGLFLTVYFTGRFFLEFFKEYEAVPKDFPLTMGQMLSIPAAVAGMVLLWRTWKKPIGTRWRPELSAVAGRARSGKSLKIEKSKGRKSRR